jgi:hypothetical protein
VGARKPPDQILDVGVPPRVPQLRRVPARERLQVRRQRVGRRHRRPLHQHGDDADAAREGAGDLDPGEVVRVLEAPAAVRTPAAQPLSPDHRDEDIAGADLPVDGLHEVDSGLEARDVHEDRALPESRPQPVEQTARVACRVLPSIADEDARHT